MDNITIENINVFELEVPLYNERESNLLTPILEDFKFNPKTDFIEAKIYDESKNLIYSDGDYSDGGIYNHFSIIENDVKLNIENFFKDREYNSGVFYTIYNFYRKICSDNNLNDFEYFISEIDSSRKEIEIKLIRDINDNILSSINEFIDYRKKSNKFVDFIISFGRDNFICNNIKLDYEDGDLSLFIKLYEPLPTDYDIHSQLLLLLEINNPQGYKVIIENTYEEEDNSIKLRGPNFNVDVTEYSSNDSNLMSLNDIESLGLLEIQNKFKSLISDNKYKLNIDYSKFENFIHFSSAFKRFYNFIQKIKLIQLNNEIETESSSEYVNEISLRNNKDVINSFDGYEYYLYNEVYPRDINGNLINFLSDPSLEESDSNPINDQLNEWYKTYCDKSIEFDENNLDNLYWNIPEYLRDDTENYPYRLFIEMVGHSFDDIWVYIRNIKDLYKGDNRINLGISKDMLSKLLNNFGLKIYNGNYSINDLYTSFLGTKTGSIPYQNMVSSLPVPPGNEYIETYIDVPEGEFPLNDIEYRIFKRLYHNLPYLYKGKGTINVLRTLINIYGIPSEVISINEFGEKEKIEENNDEILGKVLSSFISLQKVDYNDSLESNFNKYIEIGLSPQDQINNHISSSLGDINIDNIISDPRKFKLAGNQYKDLIKFREDYFSQYVESYNLNDFIRLVKFINNSLFKILRDFIPANTVASTGIIIKPHNLERNKINPLDIVAEHNEYESLVKSGVRNFKEYNPEYPTFHREEGSTIHITSGGTGGSVEKYNGLHTYPYSNLSDGNDVKQIWYEPHKNILGLTKGIRDNQREFYDGEYGLPIEFKNPEICRAYFSNENIPQLKFQIKLVGSNINGTTEEEFLSTELPTGMSNNDGVILIYSDLKGPKYMKITKYSFAPLSSLGVDVSSFIYNNTLVNLYLWGVKLYDPSNPGTPIHQPGWGYYNFYFSNIVPLNNEQGFLIYLNQEKSASVVGFWSVNQPGNPDPAYNMSVTGKYIWNASSTGSDPDNILSTGVTSSIPQGFFPRTPEYPKEQFIRGWASSSFYNNGDLVPTTGILGGTMQSYFDTGNVEKDRDLYHTLYNNSPDVFTPNNYVNHISDYPWFMNGGLGYHEIPSSSFLEANPTTMTSNPDKYVTFLGIEFHPFESVVSSGNFKIRTIFPNPNTSATVAGSLTIFQNSSMFSYNSSGINNYEKNALKTDILSFTLPANMDSLTKFYYKVTDPQGGVIDMSMSSYMSNYIYPSAGPDKEFPDSINITVPVDYQNFGGISVEAQRSRDVTNRITKNPKNTNISNSYYNVQLLESSIPSPGFPGLWVYNRTTQVSTLQPGTNQGKIIYLGKYVKPQSPANLTWSISNVSNGAELEVGRELWATANLYIKMEYDNYNQTPLNSYWCYFYFAYEYPGMELYEVFRIKSFNY